MKEKLKIATEFIKSKHHTTPKVGIVLGSGLGAFVDQIENKTVIPYKDIPHFGKTTVDGHAGQMILGKVKGVDVVAMQGRLHTYEGLSMEEVIFPTRLLGSLGIKILVLTNAAGGINLNFKAGCLVLITDHINLMGRNPLIGPNDNELGPRFPDMSHAYNPQLNNIIRETAKTLGHDLKEGVYAGVLGPTYETPAEIRMMRIMGADMVGMSTVPEAITAHHMGIKVCGISCVTNMGAGIIEQTLRHEDIKDEALKVMDGFTAILNHSIEKFGKI